MARLISSQKEKEFHGDDAEAAAETEKRSKLDAIRSAMESWGLTAEAAMKGLKIPVEQQKEYLALI